jgi:hypothetical protein
MLGRLKIQFLNLSSMCAVRELFITTIKIDAICPSYARGYPPLSPDPFVDICYQKPMALFK